MPLQGTMFSATAISGGSTLRDSTPGYHLDVPPGLHDPKGIAHQSPGLRRPWRYPGIDPPHPTTPTGLRNRPVPHLGPPFHNPFRIGSLAADVPGVDRFADQPRAQLQDPVGMHYSLDIPRGPSSFANSKKRNPVGIHAGPGLDRGHHHRGLPDPSLMINNKRPPDTSTIVSLYSSGFSFTMSLPLICKIERICGPSGDPLPGPRNPPGNTKNQADQMKTRLAPHCRMHLPGMAAAMALASILALTSTSARADVVWNVNIGSNIAVGQGSEITTGDNYVGAATENTTNSTWNAVNNNSVFNLLDSTGTSGTVTFDVTDDIQFGNAGGTDGDKIFKSWI